jgi:predicted nucleotidyltransferase
MIDIKRFMDAYVNAVRGAFGARIVLIGLQGSYGRGEANEDSDIDVVLILDRVSAEDLARYRGALDGLKERKKICGFVSGAEELSAWFPADLFQFYHDTAPVCGTLDFLLPQIGGDSALQAAQIGACNLYHACVHNIVHERSAELLRAAYKSAVFVLQALTYQKTGRYILRHADLLPALDGADAQILGTALRLKAQPADAEQGFETDSKRLLVWASDVIRRLAPCAKTKERL